MDFKIVKRNILLLIAVIIFILSLGLITFGNKAESAEADGSVTTELPMEYHCFNDGSSYSTEDTETYLDFTQAVKFTVNSGTSQMYDGWQTFPSKVDFRAMPLPTTDEIGDHTIYADWADKIDLTYMDLGEKSVDSIDGAGEEVSYGLMIIKAEYDDGTTSLQTVCVDFFKNSNDEMPLEPTDFPIEKNGKYIISLFFEAKGKGGDNHRIDVKFRIINTHSSEGNPNSIVIDNLGSESGNVPKNGATCNEFQVNYNNLNYISVECEYEAIDGTKSPKSVSNETKFSDCGKYTFKQKIGPFDLETFSIILDSREPKATFGNIKSNTPIMTAEGYVDIEWDAGNARQWAIACEIYNRDTYNDNNPGEILGRSISGKMKVETPGRYKAVLRFDNTQGLLAPGFKVAAYDVDVSAYDDPSVNYEKLSSLRFNYIKTKWYELDYNGICCFYGYDNALKFAMSIEDEVVRDENGFKAQYCNLYSEINKIYNKYSGTHDARISSIRRDTADNLALTEIMSSRAALRIREKYFDCDDSVERTFEEDTMFDTSYLYLDDAFQFVQNGDWETAFVNYRNCESGEEGELPYGKTMSQTGLPNGKYEITEKDKYGKLTKYTAYRDKSAPIVEIIQNDGQPHQATAGTYTVDYFSIACFIDEFDPWAVLKVNDDYYVCGEIPDTFYKSGVYNIRCYDRNKNITAFTVTVRERRLAPVISADNGNREYSVHNGGGYAVYNYSLSLLGANYPDVFYDFDINGATVSYSDICKTEVEYGVYSIKITDKYSGESVNFGIRIAEREFAPILIWDDNELARITQNALYTVNRFKVDFDDNYIDISGCPSCEHYIIAGGKYNLTATDIYNGKELNFTVVVEERDISVAAKIDYNNDVILSGGESIVVNQFKINKLTDEQLYYMTVKIDGIEYDNKGKVISTPGVYKITVANLFNGKGYESVFVINDRPLELVYRVNNDEWCVNGDVQGVIYNFIIDEPPEYLNVFVNGRKIKASEFPKLYHAAGVYEIVIIDKYSADQAAFSLELADRYMPKIVCDGNNATSVDEREYNVRRFKIVDIPSYVQVTVNGGIYVADEFITAAGVYSVEMRDIYSATSKNITVTVDGEETDVVLVYDDNQRTLLSDGVEYDLYRFRINQLTAEKNAYTKITVNGAPYTFGEYINAYGDYEIIVEDIYKNTRERAIVHIGARELLTEVYSEDGRIDYADSGIYDVKMFGIRNTAEYLIVTINGDVVADNSCEVYGFGEYSIAVIDKYNSAKVEFSIVISDRAESPEITINNDVELIAENGVTYYAYKFDIGAFAHQEVTVNGVTITRGEYVKSGSYKIRTRDKYSGTENSFDIIIKDMINTPNIIIDFGEKKVMSDGDIIFAYRFKPEYVDPYQNEYLNIYINGELFNVSGRYIVQSGVYDVRIENIYNGNSASARITVKDRPLYLPLIVNDGTAVNAVDTVKALRFKTGDCTALKEYASIHGAVYDDYNGEIGVYEYTVTDVYSNETLTVHVEVTDICGYIGFAYNKSIITDTTEIDFDYNIMDVEVRVDGRAYNASGSRLELADKGNGTHYYIRIINKYDLSDVYEIYVIVRGTDK